MRNAPLKRSSFFLLALALAMPTLQRTPANAQGTGNDEGFISYEAPPDEFPDDQDLLPINNPLWQGIVSLYPEQPYPDDSVAPLCSGTLISPRVVLTALHCVIQITPANKNQFLVAAGDASLREVRKINRVITRSMPRDPDFLLSELYSEHFDAFASAQLESYEAMTAIDVALVVLDQPMRKISPIEMIPTSFTLKELGSFRFSPAGYPLRSRSVGIDNYRNAVSNLKSCGLARASRFAATLVTDCTVSPGSSGGPLIVTLQHFPFVAGVAGTAIIKQKYSQPGEGELQESYHANLLDPEIRGWIDRTVESVEKTRQGNREK